MEKCISKFPSLTVSNSEPAKDPKEGNPTPGFVPVDCALATHAAKIRKKEMTHATSFMGFVPPRLTSLLRLLFNTTAYRQQC